MMVSQTFIQWILENRLVEKITNHPSIDTSPSYSPMENTLLLILIEGISANIYCEK